MARIMRIGFLLLACGLLVLGVYFFYGTLRSEILISDRMSEFIDTVDRSKAPANSKLIFLDLDDTVFMSTKLVGTPTWYYNSINLVRQSGAAKHEAYAVMSKIDKIVQQNVHVVAIEQATLSAIRTWQQQGSLVVALSSRPHDLADITKAQLDEIGISFKSTLFSCVEKVWDKYVGTFRYGIIFAGDYATKQVALDAFYDAVKECGMTVKLFAQADDQGRYVGQGAKIAKEKRVDFIGIIYGGALSTRNFDILEANRQLLNLEVELRQQIIPSEYRYIFVADNT